MVTAIFVKWQDFAKTMCFFVKMLRYYIFTIIFMFLISISCRLLCDFNTKIFMSAKFASQVGSRSTSSLSLLSDTYSFLGIALMQNAVLASTLLMFHSDKSLHIKILHCI